jgi:hypothetical protein
VERRQQEKIWRKPGGSPASDFLRWLRAALTECARGSSGKENCSLKEKSGGWQSRNRVSSQPRWPSRPAHTWYELRLIFPRLQVGDQSTLGVDTVLAPPN